MKLIEKIFPETFDVQQQHEIKMRDLGRQRTQKRLSSHVSREEESVTSYGKAMVVRTIRPLAEAIQKYLEMKEKEISTGQGQPPEAFVKLCQTEPEVIALITAKHIINTITQRKPLTATAITLGGRVETESALRNFAQLNPELYSAVKQDLDKRTWNYNYKRRKLRESANRDNDGNWTEWTTSEKAHVGHCLIGLLAQSTGLIEFGFETIKKRKTRIIKPTDKTWEFLQKRNEFNALLNPEYLPTIIPPRGWDKPSGGGYWTEHLPPLDLVKQRNKTFKKELESYNMPEVYDAVNRMQATPFRINVGVFEVMREAYDKELPIAGLPSQSNQPIPNKPHDIDSNENSRRLWKKEAVIVHTENARLFSKRLLYNKILWEAEMFVDYETIYFPLQLDFRGRAYCVPAFLNYQGIGGAKALLEFSKGKEITEDNNGAFWLAVHGANCWDHDKISLEDRVAWVQENDELFVNCANEPFVHTSWQETSSPFQTLAWCIEWRDFLDKGYGFVSHLPVSIDGSCNGLQLYSLLLQDEKAGKLVNCVPCDKPQDIYQLVANSVTDNLKADAKAGKEFAQAWLDYGIKRSTTKRSIMTICYGSTRYSCTDFVIEDLQKRKDKGEQHPFTDDVFKPATYLASVIWNSIGDNLASARTGMDFLQSIARIVSQEQLPIHWTSPVGFPVYQSYPEMKSSRIKTMLMGEVIKPRLKIETDKTDKLKMANGIAPNFVHALDSSAMMRTVNIAYAKGIRNFCNVHDSFGTTAGDVETLTESLKEAFIKIFTNNDVLEKFRDEVMDQVTNPDLKLQFPMIPAKGSLDIWKLNDCDFFFS